MARLNFLPGMLYRFAESRPHSFGPNTIMIVSAVALEPHVTDGMFKLLELKAGHVAPIVTQRRRSFWLPLWEDADAADR